MHIVSASNQCREERSINGMALQGFVFKKFSVRAFHECDISCEKELTCQSYNYVVGENSCELNNRTKEARPEHFRSDPARVYLRRLSNRGMYKVISKLRCVDAVQRRMPTVSLIRKRARLDLNTQRKLHSSETFYLNFSHSIIVYLRITYSYVFSHSLFAL